MSAYSTVAKQLNQVPEDSIPSIPTPTHGGFISGHEFDMPVGQAVVNGGGNSQYPQQRQQYQYRDKHYYEHHQQEYNNQQHTAAHNIVPTTLPVPPSRGPTLNSHRPRPLSMPPQSYAHPNVVAVPHAGPSPTERSHTSGDENKERRRPREEHAPSRRSGKRILGEYTLSKTLGAGSMGQVRLATHNVTGEKFAVKILPRVHPSPSSQTNGSSSNTDTQVVKQAQKDVSKEIRTLREAALSMLLYHPYICGMREMIVHQHHYYMVSEYVNGGQMLDYIISHGRLRERVARKFARQIGSALMYCHLNNVVHRDLKIENILISQTGNIKIIDFGLSNLYNPIEHLSTFCGSLYFAAPELLSAKVYTGPEVDVWSFGVVIYVLVCGKVPFDDQSMPALHAKIKRGMAEYPVWLSAECKHLLSRMLVTNPGQRAPLAEVMSHPWMVRGFMGPPAVHMIHREPLRSDELDYQVIKLMKGFEFGSEDEIERQLFQIIESDSYQRAVQHWERRRSVGHLSGNGTFNSSTRNGTGVSNSSLAISIDSNTGKPDHTSAATNTSSTPHSSKRSKRFSGFEYYRKKLFSGGSAAISGTGSIFGGHDSRNGTNDRDSLDPTQGFHPMISIYYLAREKIERDRVYGPGQFASSQLSMSVEPQPTTMIAAAEDKILARSALPQQYSSNQPHYSAPGNSPPRKDSVPSTKAKADYSMPLPRLPAPETSHYSDMSYGPTTASPTTAAFAVPQIPTPRARDPGASLPVPPSPILTTSPTPVVSPTALIPVRQHVEIDQNATVGPKRGSLPRAPPPSTHRRSHSMSQRPTMLTTRWGGMFSGGPTTPDENGRVFAEPPRSAVPESPNPESDDKNQDYPSHFSGGATLVRKFGSLLVGGEGSRRHAPGKRGTILGSILPATNDDEKAAGTPVPVEKEKGREDESPQMTVSDITRRQTPPPPPIIANTTPPSPTTPSIASSVPTRKSFVTQQFANAHRRAATILDPQGRAARHERRSSTGGVAIMSNTGSAGTNLGGTIGRNRRPSTGYSSSGKPFADKLFGHKTSEPLSAYGVEGEMAERREDEFADAQEASEVTDREEDDRAAVKPIFLKGLFSVATTTTKQPGVIKVDIRRVLDRMQVQFRETKTGFECLHLPSIDITSIDPTLKPGHAHHQLASSTSETSATTTVQTRPSIVKKTSKLSFGLRREKEKDKGKEREHDDREREPTRRPSGVTTLGPTHSSASSSFFNMTPNTPAIHGDLHTNGATSTSANPETTSQYVQEGSSPPRSHSPIAQSTLSSKSKTLPPIPKDFAVSPGRTSPLQTGEADKDMFESMGSSPIGVRFEINIVKVPFLPFHGIQFRRIGGDAWQYQMLARRVLTELKL